MPPGYPKSASSPPKPCQNRAKTVPKFSKQGARAHCTLKPACGRRDRRLNQQDHTSPTEATRTVRILLWHAALSGCTLVGAPSSLYVTRWLSATVRTLCNPLQSPCRSKFWPELPGLVAGELNMLHVAGCGRLVASRARCAAAPRAGWPVAASSRLGRSDTAPGRCIHAHAS